MRDIAEIRRWRRIWITRCKQLSYRQPPRALKYGTAREVLDRWNKWDLDCEIAYARLARVTRRLPDEEWLKIHH